MPQLSSGLSGITADVDVWEMGSAWLSEPPSPPSPPTPPRPFPAPPGWTPTYCQSCETNPLLKDLGHNYAIADCIDACVREGGCKFANWAETTDKHCILYAE